MAVYTINEHEVSLFTMRYLRSIFNVTKSAIVKKEERGHLPPANYRTGNGVRLYSIEDLSVIEYVYKEVWPYKQGVKVPEWVKELVFEAFAISKAVVVQYGYAPDVDYWKSVDNKYTQFSRYRLQIYLESWRRRLLDNNKFFPELVEDENEF